jgi:hypothetical protein
MNMALLRKCLIELRSRREAGGRFGSAIAGVPDTAIPQLDGRRSATFTKAHTVFELGVQGSQSMPKRFDLSDQTEQREPDMNEIKGYAIEDLRPGMHATSVAGRAASAHAARREAAGVAAAQ